MNANELVDTYLAHKGMRRVKGEGYDAILPFFMLDSMYQILSKEISPIPCRQEQKLALKKWKEGIRLYVMPCLGASGADHMGCYL